jgi:hypothetical protein
MNFMFSSKCCTVFKMVHVFLKFEILFNDLIVKVCYNKSLFYIITINIYENLKYMIIRENF